MARRVYCIVLLQALLWSNCVGAQDRARRSLLDAPHSALPWLSLDSLSATRDRPLFVPDRRKALPPPPHARVAAGGNAQRSTLAAVPPPMPHLQLTGIFVDPADTLVFLRDDATSKSVAVHSGDTVGRWRVVADSDFSVKLIDGTREFRLEMFTTPDTRLRALP